MPVSVLFAFTAVAATLIVLPGPDWALVLAAGTRGQGRVPATVGGIAIGYLLITAVVAAGVAPLIASTSAALVILTVVGAVYLLYLGIGILRRPVAHEPIATAQAPATGAGRTLVQGIGVSALNPKALLFFLAFLPQFARPGAAWPVAVQLLVLGGVWVVLGSTFYTLLGCTAERTIARRPRLALTVTRVAGIAMIVAGIALLSDQLLHAEERTPLDLERGGRSHGDPVCVEVVSSARP